MLSYFEDFITLCSALHFAYWWQQKSYLPKLCEELPAEATWWLPAGIVTRYFMNCCEWIPSNPPEEIQEHFENLMQSYLLEFVLVLMLIRTLWYKKVNIWNFQNWEMQCPLWRLVAIKRKNGTQSNSCQRSNWEINDCLKWLSMKQNNIWHRPTLALIGRRGLIYGKEDSELNGHLNRRNQIPVLFLIQRGVESHLLVDSSFPRHIKNVISSWIRRRRSLSLDKIMKMDHDNLRKSCIGKLPDRFGT